MKKSTLIRLFLNHKTLIFSLIAVWSIVFSVPAHGETIKVRKVKGNQAIIETITPLEEGQTYELNLGPISQEVDYKKSVFKPRNNSLTFGASYEYIKSDLLSLSAYSMQVRYGWNFTSVEGGILASISSTDNGGGADTTYLGGAYFDYNVVPNREPNHFIWGPFILASVGSRNLSGGGSASLLQTNAGGFATYFFADSTTALRGELFYNYQQINTSAQQNSVGGFGARGLLVFYF